MDYNQSQGQQPYNNVPEAPAMDFQTAVRTCFNKYADFSGRATRAEYWWWVLFNVIVSIVVGVVAGIIPHVGQFISYAVSLALLIPSLAVAWRRLHDMGRAGGWYFIGLIPLVGWIILIVWLCALSQPFDNRFGPYKG